MIHENWKTVKRSGQAIHTPLIPHLPTSIPAKQVENQFKSSVLKTWHSMKLI
jgi:hypothetical protein